MVWPPSPMISERVEFNRADIAETREYFTLLAAEVLRDPDKMITVEEHPTLKLFLRLTVHWKLDVEWTQGIGGFVPICVQKQTFALGDYGTLILERRSGHRPGWPLGTKDGAVPQYSELDVDAQIANIEIERNPDGKSCKITIDLINAFPNTPRE